MSITNNALCWPRLSTLPTAGQVLPAHAQTGLAYTGKGRQQHIHVHNYYADAACRVCALVFLLLLFLYSLSMKLVFMPVASATIAIHSDCLVLPSNTQQPKIKTLVSCGQIVLLTSMQYNLTQMDNNIDSIH